MGRRMYGLFNSLCGGISMLVQCRRAVVVGMTGCVAPDAALAAAGIEIAGCAADGAGGLRLLRRAQPDLAVVRAVMPGIDGAAFARQARQLRLGIQPGILLLAPAGLPLPGAAELDALAAAVLIWPAGAGAMAGALARLSRMELAPGQKRAERLEMLLDALGVPEHPGRDCLGRAVALCWRDRRAQERLRDWLYPELARRTGLSAGQAERAIRHVIDAAWRNGEIDQQHRIFGDTIDATRGKPTCGEMIAQLAEELRWEG